MGNRNNMNKTNFYILGESMVKNWMAIYWQGKLDINILLKCVHFRGRIPVVWWTMLNNFTRYKPESHCSTCRHKRFKNWNTASQIGKATIDIVASLKKDGNTVTVSGIAPRLDELNKANKVNRRLVLMCKERNISFLSHDESIDLVSTWTREWY